MHTDTYCSMGAAIMLLEDHVFAVAENCPATGINTSSITFLYMTWSNFLSIRNRGVRPRSEKPPQQFIISYLDLYVGSMHCAFSRSPSFLYTLELFLIGFTAKCVSSVKRTCDHAFIFQWTCRSARDVRLTRFASRMYGF